MPRHQRPIVSGWPLPGKARVRRDPKCAWGFVQKGLNRSTYACSIVNGSSRFRTGSAGASCVEITRYGVTVIEIELQAFRRRVQDLADRGHEERRRAQRSALGAPHR
jgi:hypothetical protein